MIPVAIGKKAGIAGRCDMPKLYYQGHGSYRLTSDDGRIVYVDPYAGDGYDLPVGAKHNIPIHLKPGALFDRKKADKWDAPNKLIVEPGLEIAL
jgi:hypothetical protein